MKNQKVIIIVVIVFIAIVGGGYYLLSSKKEQTIVDYPQPVGETIKTLSSEDIGLTLTSINDNKEVLMEIRKTEDISSLDYELSYTARGGLTRGSIGTDIKPKGQPVKQKIVLGSCSAVCHYDEEVSNIKIIIKVTKTDNKVYQVEKTLPTY